MGGEVEAAGDALTGAIVAGTVEGQVNAAGRGAGGEKTAAPVACQNCGSKLTGAFCAMCGQRAHLHRSLLALGHDILHGVFHFEGKVWRTIPELFLHPGRLTRRYIAGERAKFVSPMAMFLFTAFVMFAAFSFTGGALLDDDEISTVDEIEDSVVTNWKGGNQTAIEATQRNIDALRKRREDPALSDAERAELDARISDLESAHEVMNALKSGNFSRVLEVKSDREARAQQTQQQPGSAPAAAAPDKKPGNRVQIDGWPRLERKLQERLDELNSSPGLLLYKLKTNGYKFSWALIPLSLPFIWLLFFWRFDIRLYDHAVFVTYSISFMMLLIVLASLAAAFGVSSSIWATALVFVPPIHMYRQLRAAYGLSRFGAWIRLFFLSIFSIIVLIIFTVLLFVMGVLS